MKKQLRSRSGNDMMLQELEPRRLLSGNVTAALVSGVLVVSGDNKSNDVQVVAGAGSTSVVPVPGTTVNGGTAPVVFGGFPDIKISTGNGDDHVEVVDPLHQSISVDTGNGDDSVSIHTQLFIDTSVNNLDIETGNGNDSVSLDIATLGQDYGNVKIDTGNGNDSLTIAGNVDVGGNIDVDGGHGFDVLDPTGITGISVGGAVSVRGFETIV